MASSLIPLSRRPRWLLLFLVPLGLALSALFSSALASPKPFLSAAWLSFLYMLIVLVLIYRGVKQVIVADYDADYLYVFQKSSTQPIPLGSFYKLAATNGAWRLYYLDAQRRKRQLLVVAQNTGWFGRSDNSSIHGFIDAVRQHSPNLDVRHGLFR